MWVFGYGSLIWKVDFPFEQDLIGYICGYVRRFAQHSIDHRGIPDKPGRVVTLLPSSDPKSTVWGRAYKIRSSDIESVSKHLDFREKNGYTKSVVKFFPKDGTKCFDITLYVATEENQSFAGEAEIEQIAEEVISSVGPSGTNKEYVYNLADSMRSIAPGVNDQHLFQLEKAVKQLDPDIKYEI